MRLYEIEWDCAMMQFQDLDENTIIKSEKEPTRKQAEKAIEDISTGSVYVNNIKEVREIDIRYKNNRFYEIKDK